VAYFYASPLSSLARAAGSSTGDTPNYLVRSTYQDLTNYDFTVGGIPLKFQSVGDFGAAAVQRNLADNEDAFSVVFTGPVGARLGTGVQTVTNAEIGDFSALIVPVGEAGATQDYEFVVNRVLNRTDSHLRPPKAPATSAPSTSALAISAPVVSPQGPAAKTTKHKPAVRKITAKRTRTGVRFALVLRPGAHIRGVTGWLKRDEATLGATTRKVGADRLSFNVKLGRRPRKGDYHLELLTTDRDGAQVIERHRVKLR
jgi:hypothetical protein